MTARLTCLDLFLPRPLPLSIPSQTLRRTPPSADPSLARSLMSTELTQGSVELLSHPIPSLQTDTQTLSFLSRAKVTVF